MKKGFLSLVALATFGLSNAQMKEKGTLEITPKIGISSYAEYDNNNHTDSNSGVAFGVTTDYYFNNRWSLRSGVSFDKMGGEYQFNGTIEDKINYISIPVNANWHFGSTRKWNLNFGLSPSFLTSATTEGVDIKDGLESFQLGLSYGIGYKIEVTPKFGVLIDMQLFSGLTNISADRNFDYRNSGGGFNVGAVLEL
ncbi:MULTISPECIES: porin family protein [unclassified Flavobacterium]|uniref:porin family protein n=1 Tax=unclassified Flavobacterium TaxID=196869 RepID=UPI003F8DDF14